MVVSNNNNNSNDEYRIKGKLINKLTVKELQDEIILLSPNKSLFKSNTKKADLLNTLTELLKQAPIQQQQQQEEQQEEQPQQEPIINENNKRSHDDKQQKQTQDVNKKTKTITLHEKLEQLKQELNETKKFNDKLIEELGEVVNNIEKNNHTKIKNINQKNNSLVINDSNNNSEFAQALYEKILKEFNLYPIISTMPQLSFSESNEFVKFMILKVMYGDTVKNSSKGSKLIASPMVQKLWEGIAIFTGQYNEFLKVLGQDVYYNLFDKKALDSINRNEEESSEKRKEYREKYEKTIELYKKYFPSSSKDLEENSSQMLDNENKPKKTENRKWPFEYLKSKLEIKQLREQEVAKRIEDKKQKVIKDRSLKEEQAKDVSQINIRVLSSCGKETNFRMKKNTPLYKLTDAYLSSNGMKQGEARFMYDFSTFPPYSTPASLNIEDGDIIEVITSKSGC